MGEQRHNREPKLARTDFESMTHEQLAALLASANTAGASHLSSKLSKAASTITKIGDDLMTYVKGLEWQGEGGDAFRDWGGQTASSTLRLGQYAEVAARWMGTVSQAIAEAKAAMPDVSETTRAKTDLADAHKTITAANQPGGHNDPDAQKLAATARTDATAAEHRMEAARGEAIQQLRKLAQTYEYSAQQVNSVAPPTFSPPVGQAGNDNWWVGESKEHLPSPPTHTGNGSVGATLSSRQGGGSHSHTVSPGGSTKSADGLSSESGSRDRGQTPPVSMDIDSTGTLSRETPTIGVPTSPGTGQSHREVSLPQQSAPVPPTVASGGRAFPQNPSAQGHAAPASPNLRATRGRRGARPAGPVGPASSEGARSRTPGGQRAASRGALSLERTISRAAPRWAGPCHQARASADPTRLGPFRETDVASLRRPVESSALVPANLAEPVAAPSPREVPASFGHRLTPPTLRMV